MKTAVLRYSTSRMGGYGLGLVQGGERHAVDTCLKGLHIDIGLCSSHFSNSENHKDSADSREEGEEKIKRKHKNIKSYFETVLKRCHINYMAKLHQATDCFFFFLLKLGNPLILNHHKLLL